MKALAGRRVLVLEDEHHLAADIERTLDRQGATVVGPVSSLEQVRYIPLDRVDAAVLDARGRDGMGFVLARQLRARGVPFVFASGEEPGTGRDEWRDSVWIAKPYEADRLVAALLCVLAKLHAASAATQYD